LIQVAPAHKTPHAMTQTQKRKEVLINVLKDFNEKQELRFSDSELKKMGCYYAAVIQGYLKDNGYMDNKKALIKRVKPRTHLLQLPKWYYDRYEIKKEKLKEGNGQITIPINNVNGFPFEEEYKLFEPETKKTEEYAKKLVKELRDLGYDVSCKKTIIVEY